MRRSDKPGSFRILERDGAWMLSGVTLSGHRTKIPGLSREEAERLSREIFANPGHLEVPGKSENFAVDDWGIPIRVSDATVASVAAAVGVVPGPDPPKPQPAPVVDREAEEKKVRRAKQAKSIMELAGVAYAAGDVMVARKVTSEWFDKEPLNPSPRQVNDLADVTRDMITEWFGDREIKPWMMFVLLTFGIPLSMVIQSPKRDRRESKKQAESPLKSVP